MADVTFDGPNHLIIVNNGITQINTQDELYSDWKEWTQIGSNIKYYPAFDLPDGGRDLTPSIKNGDYYFLNNQDFSDGLGGTRDGWRIRPYEGNHDLEILGNLYIYDTSKPFLVSTVGSYQVLVRLVTSSLTQTVVYGSGVTSQDKLDIADAVWNETISGHTTIGSYGYEILERIKQNKETNKKYVYKEATVQNLTRNVQVGELDYFDVLIKKDDDADFSSPVSTDRLYMWYETLGDSDPLYVGESD
jgi:hypothetical protein